MRMHLKDLLCHSRTQSVSQWVIKTDITSVSMSLSLCLYLYVSLHFHCTNSALALALPISAAHASFTSFLFLSYPCRRSRTQVPSRTTTSFASRTSLDSVESPKNESTLIWMWNVTISWFFVSQDLLWLSSPSLSSLPSNSPSSGLSGSCTRFLWISSPSSWILSSIESLSLSQAPHILIPKQLTLYIHFWHQYSHSSLLP